MKNMAQIGVKPQIANLIADLSGGAIQRLDRAAAAASTPTPLALPALGRARRDPRGGHPRQISRPLCVRPSHIFGAKAVLA